MSVPETVNAEYPVKFFAQQELLADGAEYTLGLMDRETQQLIGKFGTVKAEKDSVSGYCEAFAIDMPGVDKEAYTAGDKTFEDTYRLDSTNRVPFDVTYLVSKGYFDSQIIININKYNPLPVRKRSTAPAHLWSVSSEGEGNEATVHADLDLSGIDTDALYVANAMCMKSAIQVKLGKVYFYFRRRSRRGRVTADETPARYYDIREWKLTNPARVRCSSKSQAAKPKNYVLINNYGIRSPQRFRIL